MPDKALGYCERRRNKRHDHLHFARKDCKGWYEWKDTHQGDGDPDLAFAMLEGAIQQ